MFGLRNVQKVNNFLSKPVRETFESANEIRMHSMSFSKNIAPRRISGMSTDMMEHILFEIKASPVQFYECRFPSTRLSFRKALT